MYLRSHRLSSCAVFVLAGSLAAFAADTIPPSVPTGLTATVATCSQVNLSWNASTDDSGGSGMKAYTINRYDAAGANAPITIGSNRTAFSDMSWVKSSSAYTYTVTAMDNAGNVSAPSNSASVSTPACPVSASDQVVDAASKDAFGRNIAVYGNRTALIYQKKNAQLTYDTWLYVNDSDTGQSSRFMLHGYPGYDQAETEAVLLSATELWTLSYDSTWGGKTLATRYQLNGTPVTSATLLSTQSMGDANSFPRTLIRLKSGALMMAWSEEGSTPPLDGSLNIGIAYRSSGGVWAIKLPVNIPNPDGGNCLWTKMAMAQHPVDGSIWLFAKRDSFHSLIALHLTENTSGFLIDWINPDFISATTDGVNSPSPEYPFLSAAADPTRGAILLAYESQQDSIVYMDPLFNYMNNIYLAETYPTIAQIGPSGSKSFIPVPYTMERQAQFGFSVLSDGTLWLAYQPINHQSLTWNQVYAIQYANNIWSAPALVGYKYMSQAVSNGAMDPGFIVGRTDQPQATFLTPDQKIHTVALSTSAPAPISTTDTTPPVTSITSPVSGASVSGTVAVAATATDNVGVARVDLQVDGTVVASSKTAPYTFSWKASAASSGKHTLQTVAYDAAGNIGLSALVSVSLGDTTPPTVSITSPANGSSVARNSAVTVSATASDNVGVTRVEFYVNGTLAATDTGTPYNYAWKVPGKNNATYTIKAIAYDAAGNSASSAISVTAK